MTPCPFHIRIVELSLTGPVADLWQCQMTCRNRAFLAVWSVGVLLLGRMSVGLSGSVWHNPAKAGSCVCIERKPKSCAISRSVCLTVNPWTLAVVHQKASKLCTATIFVCMPLSCVFKRAPTDTYLCVFTYWWKHWNLCYACWYFHNVSSVFVCMCLRVRMHACYVWLMVFVFTYH